MNPLRVCTLPRHDQQTVEFPTRIGAWTGKIYEDLKDIDLVYISFDIDTFDASYAPGTGSSTFAGSTPRELMPFLRQFCGEKTIVGIDIVEYNPFYDNRGQQTARLVRRTMLSLLTGIALKKKGMAPNYVHPRVSGDP